MADGSIRIDTRINTDDAKRDLDSLEKAMNKTKSKMKETGKAINPFENLSSAEKELNKANREVERLENQWQKAEVALKDYTDEYNQIRKSTGDMLKTAKTSEQKKNVKGMEAVQLEQLDEKYSKPLNNVAYITEKLEKAKGKQAELTAEVEKMRNAENKVGTSVDKTKSKVNEIKKQSGLVNKIFKGVGSTIKGIGSGLGGALSKLKQMNKSGNAFEKAMQKGVKSIKKFGLQLLGLRSIWLGLKKVVSAAMNDNEDLSKQLSNTWTALGANLTPIIEIAVNGIATAVAYLNAFITSLTGVDAVAQRNAKALKKQGEEAKKAAQSASFDEQTKLTDNSKSSDTATIDLPKVSMTDWMQSLSNAIKAGNWAGLGKIIADGLNTAMNKIPWNKIKQKTKDLALNLTTGLNSFIANFDWYLLGSTIANGLNTALIFAYTFLTTFNFALFAEGIGNGINGFISTFDWTLLGLTISSGINAAITFLLTLITTIDWTALGNAIFTSIVTTVTNIDWGLIGIAVLEGLKGALDFLSGGASALGCDNLAKALDNLKKSFEPFAVNIGIGLKWFWDNVLVPLGKWVSNDLLPAFLDLLSGSLDTLNVVIDALKPPFKWFWKNVAQPIAKWTGGIIVKTFNGLTDILKEFSAWAKKNQKNMDLITDTILSFLAGLALYLITKKISDKLSVLKSGVKALGEVLKEKAIDFGTAAGKIALFAACVFVAVNAIKEISKNWNKLNALGKVITVLTGLATAAMVAAAAIFIFHTSWSVGVAAATILAGLAAAGFASNILSKDTWTSTSDAVTDSAKEDADSFINSYDFGSDFKLPKLAVGGIVNNPGRGVPAIIGEAGAEAILPLENNTGWMDILADKINSGAGQVIIPIYLGGKQIAKYIIDLQQRRSFETNGAL